APLSAGVEPGSEPGGAADAAGADGLAVAVHGAGSDAVGDERSEVGECEAGSGGDSVVAGGDPESAGVRAVGLGGADCARGGVAGMAVGEPLPAAGVRAVRVSGGGGAGVQRVRGAAAGGVCGGGAGVKWRWVEMALLFVAAPTVLSLFTRE